MCRLLAYSTTSAATLDEVVGTALPSFVELSRQLHGDGWGMAWAAGNGVTVRKAPTVAAEDPDFAELAGSVRTEALLVHLRWATLDLGVRPENTHPFTDGHMAFAHNGSVPDPGRLDALIDPAMASDRRGDTDSERLFLAVRSRLPSVGGDPARALAATITTVAATLHFSSLNCMLLTPERLHVVCRYDPATLSADLPGDYYDLHYEQTPGAVVVGSTGWSQEGWRRLANGEMLVVDRSTLATSVVPLEEAAR